MDLHPIFHKYPELREFVRILEQKVQQATRPANEIVLTDQQVMKFLNISERKLDSIKSEKSIPFSQEKPRARCYWLLADVVAWINKNRVEPIDKDLRI